MTGVVIALFQALIDIAEDFFIADPNCAWIVSLAKPFFHLLPKPCVVLSLCLGDSRHDNFEIVSHRYLSHIVLYFWQLGQYTVVRPPTTIFFRAVSQSVQPSPARP